MSQLLFSVVICTYQRYDLLGRAIESVLRQTLDPALFDIWIMDNSPDSEERRACAKRYEGVDRLHYILLDRPGIANARNQGFAYTSAPYVAYLDDDADANPDWLEAYQKALVATPQKIGVFGGRIDPDFELPPPSWLDAALQTPFSLLNCSTQIGEFPGTTTPFSMNAIVSREAFQECGPFDTSLGRIGSEFSNLLSGEETSLFRNMREKGWRLFYAPGAIVRHRIGVKRMTQAWVRRRMAWQAVADQMMSPLKPDEILPAFVGLMQYVQLVPPQHRAFMGLLWDTPDPDLFKKQIIALMYAMKLFLATGAYPQEIRFNP